jgi:hypothetical protein
MTDCGTSFMFQTAQSLLPDVSGRRQIWLIIGVYRWLGPLTMLQDPGNGDDDDDGECSQSKLAMTTRLT